MVEQDSRDVEWLLLQVLVDWYGHPESFVQRPLHYLGDDECAGGNRPRNTRQRGITLVFFGTTFLPDIVLRGLMGKMICEQKTKLLENPRRRNLVIPLFS